MRVLLRPSWVALFIVSGLLFVLFINLGLWQRERLDERRAENALIAERMDADEMTVEAALALVGQTLDVPAMEYAGVTASGRFDAERLLMIRNETFGGRAGFHLAVPLVMETRVLLVNIGWVPLETDREQAMSVVPPGQIQLRGLLRPTQTRPSFGREEPDGVLTTINRVDIDRLQAQFEESLFPFWVQLEEPDDQAALPIPLARPALDEGSHLSYMIQWFSFALIVAVGVVALARRDVLEGTGAVKD